MFHNYFRAISNYVQFEEDYDFLGMTNGSQGAGNNLSGNAGGGGAATFSNQK